MKKTIFAALLVAGILPLGDGLLLAQESSGPSMSEEDIQLLRQNIRSQKRLLIAANLPLTDAEAQKFWPITADESMAALRVKYIPVFRKVLPAKKLARFFQLEHGCNPQRNTPSRDQSRD